MTGAQTITRQDVKERKRLAVTRLLCEELKARKMTTMVNENLVAYAVTVGSRVRAKNLILPKDQKKAAKEVVVAITKIQIALRNNLKYTQLGLHDCEKLDQWKEEATRIAYADLPNKGPETIVSRQRKQAVKAAATLLLAHNLPLAISDNGLFHEVAAVLYGDSKANLKHLLKSIKAELETSVKTAATEGLTGQALIP